MRMPHLGWMKAKLHALDKDFERARVEIASYAAYVAQPKSYLRRQDVEEDLRRAALVEQEISALAQQKT